MKKYIWVGKIYPDWFREPMSPLERTWRLPVLFQVTQEFLGEKFHLRIPDDFHRVENGYIVIRKNIGTVLLQPGIVYALFKIIHEIKTTKVWFEKGLLPEYRTISREWQKEDLENKSDQELWQFVNAVMRKDVECGLRIGYVGIYCFLFEALLRSVYRWWIQDDPQGYQTLLIGFENRTHEMNRTLFELSKLDSESDEFKEQFQGFISEFGSKKADWELVMPTFGENQKAVLGLIELYRQHPDLDPEKRFGESVRLRKEKENFVNCHIRYRILRPFFGWILTWAQTYVPLRETRQHYIVDGGGVIRRSLNLLAKRHGIAQDLVFYLEATEVEQLVSGIADVEYLKGVVQERYELREQQKEHTPV